MTSTYDSIRELDKERRGKQVVVAKMSLADYMIPPPFWELGSSIKEEEEVREEPSSPIKLANKSNRIRVKNIRTGVSFEFFTMANAARFLGATRANMSYGIVDQVAKVYCVGEEEYVFEYDGEERPLEDGSRCSSLDGSVVAVSGKGERIPFPSFLSAAKYLGLLVGHILEEEKRAREGKRAKRYLTIGTFTLEFGGEKRVIDGDRGMVCYCRGIYDGDWRMIRGIKVTYGNPQMRD